jgi:hypothetical protein
MTDKCFSATGGVMEHKYSENKHSAVRHFISMTNHTRSAMGSLYGPVSKGVSIVVPALN